MKRYMTFILCLLLILIITSCAPTVPSEPVYWGKLYNACDGTCECSGMTRDFYIDNVFIATIKAGENYSTQLTAGWHTFSVYYNGEWLNAPGYDIEVIGTGWWYVNGCEDGTWPTTTPTDGSGGTPLRILPGYTLSACIDTYTGTSRVVPQTLMAAGGSPFAGYTWSKPALSSFPMGTTVVPLTGVFVGTGGSLIAGKHTFTVEVYDGTSTATGSVTLYVTTASSAPSDGVPGVGCPTAILQQYPSVSFALDDAHANKPYGASLFAMGGTPPYSWSEDITYSALSDLTAAGLTLDAAKGIVRGTPFNSSSGKTLKFRVIVRDNAGDTSSGPVYTITVQ